jgi:hypothetical protein
MSEAAVNLWGNAEQKTFQSRATAVSYPEIARLIWVQSKRLEDPSEAL